MEMILNIVATVAIPFIVQLLKKWLKLSSKFAPIMALVLAVIYVGIAKASGLDADVNSVYQAIMLAIGIGGASVLGYDVTKKLTEKTPTK